jgi:hypothetical protein
MLTEMLVVLGTPGRTRLVVSSSRSHRYPTEMGTSLLSTTFRVNPNAEDPRARSMTPKRDPGTQRKRLRTNVPTLPFISDLLEPVAPRQIRT